MSTSHILLRELERQRRRMHTVKVKEVEDQLHLLHFVLRKLGQVYPLVGEYLFHLPAFFPIHLY